jgi:hypothetical protein
MLDILVLKEQLKDSLIETSKLRSWKRVRGTEDEAAILDEGMVRATEDRVEDGMHQANQVMTQQVGPQDPVALPEEIREALQRIVEVFWGCKVYLLVLQFMKFIKQSLGGAKSI